MCISDAFSRVRVVWCSCILLCILLGDASSEFIWLTPVTTRNRSKYTLNKLEINNIESTNGWMNEIIFRAFRFVRPTYNAAGKTRSPYLRSINSWKSKMEWTFKDILGPASTFPYLLLNFVHLNRKQFTSSPWPSMRRIIIEREITSSTSRHFVLSAFEMYNVEKHLSIYCFSI